MSTKTLQPQIGMIIAGARPSSVEDRGRMLATGTTATASGLMASLANRPAAVWSSICTKATYVPAFHDRWPLCSTA